MSSKKWKVVDTTLALIGGICGIVGLFTGFKSIDYEEEVLFEDLEKKYGLEPIGREGDGEDE